MPFNWKERETAIYLVFKAAAIKPNTWLLELDESTAAAKKLSDPPGKEFLFLPTNFQTEKELKDSELYKALKADHNATLAKEIGEWIQSQPSGK